MLIDNKPDTKELSRDDELVQMSYEFGINIGIAIQLIDDVLDFTPHSDKLSKPECGADLRLGLATAPVLFAATTYPQLNPMIMSRFKNEGDVFEAFEFVMKSDGIAETTYLAAKYCQNAENILAKFSPSEETENLKTIIRKIVNREK